MNSASQRRQRLALSGLARGSRMSHTAWRGFSVARQTSPAPTRHVAYERRIERNERRCTCGANRLPQGPRQGTDVMPNRIQSPKPVACGLSSRTIVGAISESYSQRGFFSCTRNRHRLAPKGVELHPRRQGSSRCGRLAKRRQTLLAALDSAATTAGRLVHRPAIAPYCSGQDRPRSVRTRACHSSRRRSSRAGSGHGR